MEELEERPETETIPPPLNDGRDELNLAEFPLCAIAHRLNPDQKTLVFEDRVWDDNRDEMITRQLTITGSDAYGLPTALDDEVLLGLIQLSKLQNFADRKVAFSRYQLIHILGWRDETKSYERLEASLNRWTGVTLYYQNAWWNKADQCWVDEKFHVLDNVRLFHRDHPPPPRSRGRQTDLPFSTFVWNEVLFKSFSAGNLKSIDFDFFKELESAIAKRLYRFLDKRFYHRTRWEFNLKEFAWEHVGLAQGYDTANLKRKLRPAIEELEHRGYLRPLGDAERFRKIRSGEWRVIFEKASEAAAADTPQSAPEALPLIQALTERGVTASTAQETVTRYPADRIRAQLEVFDWLAARQDPKVSRNPPGFLISSIKSEYAPPREFVSQEEQARRTQKAAERQRRQEERQQALETQARDRAQARDTEIRRFWDSLSDGERVRLEKEALDHASAFQRKLLDRGGSLAPAARKAILDAYALNVLKAGV